MAGRWLAGALVVAAVAGCGGGGGGGTGSDGGGGGGGGAMAPTLTFTSANAGRVGGYPLWGSEAVMRVGHALAQEFAAAAVPGAATSGGCASGRWERSWADRDSSGTLSAGDMLTVTYTACAQEPLSRSAQGTVTLTLSSVGSGGGFSGRMAIAEPGLGLANSVGVALRPELVVTGQGQLDLEVTGSSRSLTVSGPEAGDRFVLAVPGYPSDVMTAFRLQKTQRFDEARSLLQLQMRYDSPELGGSFDVRTPTPLRSWLDTLPEPHAGQGLLEMTGRGFDRVRITISSGSQDLGLTLDQGGDGSIEATGGGSWFQVGLVSGYFFADYTPGGRGAAYAYSASEFTMRPPFGRISGEPVDSVFRVQFTRPPAAAAAWRWRLIDLGRLPWNEDATGEVALDVQQQGALFVLRPQQRLRYSRRYELMLDTGAPTASGQLLQASTGGSIDLWQGRVGSFQTPDHLNTTIFVSGASSVATPGGGLRLQALPAQAGAPLPAYRWEQVSGTPLVIETPGGRETALRLAGVGQGVGAATVRLTMTLPDGSSDSSVKVVRTLHNTDQAWTTRLKTAATQQIAPPPPVYDAWGGPAVGTLVVQESPAAVLQAVYTDSAATGSFPSWTLELGTADGTPLQPGRYTRAWTTAGATPPPGSPLLNLQASTGTFLPTDSEFEVHEIERGPGGQITRLAVDIVVRGGGDVTPITGAVRLNSLRPVP